MARLTTDLSARLWSDGNCTRWMTIRGFAYLTNSSSSSKLFRTRSRRYLRNSFFRCLALNPDGPTECTCLFLPRCHRPSLDPSQVGFPFRPRTRFFRGEVSRLSSDISYVQASEFACLPDRSHRCRFRRAAETSTSRRNVLRCLCTHRICYPSDTGN